MGFAGAPLTYTPPPLPQRIGRLMFEIEGYTAAPTPSQQEQIEAASKLLKEATDAVHKLVEEDVASLNKALNDAEVPRITAIEVTPPEHRE